MIINDWKYLIENIKLIYQDVNYWGGGETIMTNIKPAIFAHLRFIELIHPSSAYCYKIDSELRYYFRETEDVFAESERALKVTENFFNHLGDIMKEIAEIDECFYYWNGKCTGQRMGMIMNHLLVDGSL